MLPSGPQILDVAYDPEGDYLAAVACSGMLQVGLSIPLQLWHPLT